MNLRHFCILLLLSSGLLVSCTNTSPKLKIAREVYKNDLRGIELFHALSAEQKHLVLKNIGSIVIGGGGDLKKHYGKYPTGLIQDNSKNVRRIKTYKQPIKDYRPSKKPKSKLYLLDWTMQTYNQLKRKCDSTIVEFNKDFLPVLVDTTINIYHEGRLLSSGNKNYSYSGDTIKTNWVDQQKNKIETIRTLKGGVLEMVKYVNGKQSNIISKTKYNKNMQPVYFIHMYDWLRSEFKAQGEYALIQYNENDKPIKIKRNSIKVEEGDTIPYNYRTENFSYHASELLSYYASDENFLGMHLNQKNNFYNFFEDDEGRLNIYKLSCSPFSNINKGELTHYVFDKYANVLYYQSNDFKYERSYSRFKEYEYFD